MEKREDGWYYSDDGFHRFKLDAVEYHRVEVLKGEQGYQPKWTKRPVDEVLDFIEDSLEDDSSDDDDEEETEEDEEPEE